MKCTLLLSVLLVSGVAFAQAPTVAPQTPATRAEGPALLVLISDLHLGYGEASGGVWYPQEDFRWASEFVLFLTELRKKGAGKTTLVLNGDSFELWESGMGDCLPPTEAGLGCSETEAVNRIRKILLAHRSEEHTSELQSRQYLVCRLLLEKK